MFAPAPWDEARDTLRAALADAGEVDALAALVAAGRAAVFAFQAGQGRGFVAVGPVADGMGRDLAVYACAGVGKGMTAPLSAGLEFLARQAGLEAVRACTDRPGLIRRLGDLGWREEVRVLRREVAHG